MVLLSPSLPFSSSDPGARYKSGGGRPLVEVLRDATTALRRDGWHNLARQTTGAYKVAEACALLTDTDGPVRSLVVASVPYNTVAAYGRGALRLRSAGSSSLMHV